jgi:F-type H+-transporting ATPase subunit b
MIKLNKIQPLKIKLLLPLLIFASFIYFPPVLLAATQPTDHTEVQVEAMENQQASESGTHTAAPEEHVEQVSVLGTLGINWKLFIAQLINFAIVLFVLWKWVLTPVANKLTERADKIEKSINDANRIEKEKQEFEVWKDSEMSKARQEASALISKAQSDAGKAKDEIMLAAKLEQEKIVEAAKKQIEDQKNESIKSAKAELADMITGAAEKILRHKLDSAKDKELIKESLGSIK